MPVTRRSFLAAAAAASLQGQSKTIPIGLEMFSVRNALMSDLMGTIRKVAQMGYQDMEFYAPYYQWSIDQARQVRKLLDDTGTRCLSTHNAITSYQQENIQKAIELNNILGCEFMVIASAGNVRTLDQWKRTADTLAFGAELLQTVRLRGGYHNHKTEFEPIDGKRPIEVIAANTPKNFMLQLDVGTCVEAGADPVAWINANPGRIQSLHLKDWSKSAGYRVLFGEGDVKWKPIFEAAESVGGVEFYLIEQEGSDFSEFDTAQKCLANFRAIHTS